MNGLVSVILPVYNVEKYIREALDSVINQTYKNLEIILVDDGSPDSSGNICDECARADSRIKVIHKENGGVSSARNAGINAAMGDWIYFIDPDDWIEHDTIETAVSFAVESSCDMCIFDYENVYKNQRLPQDSFKHEGAVFRDLTDINVFFAYSCSGCAVWCCITRAGFIKKLRFDESLANREDEIFMWQLYGSIGSICHKKKILYHYRCVASSASNSPVFQRNINNYIKIYNMELDIIKGAGYPENAAVAAHSKYIELFFAVCAGIFSADKPLNKRIAEYEKYISGREFTESVISSTDLYFSKAARIIFKMKKAPGWFSVYVLLKLRGLRDFFKNKTKF